jgi:hypothetical protein
MTATRTQNRTAAHVTPLRIRAADEFLVSARDMGDKAIIEAAIEIYWHVRFRATKPASEAALAIYTEWKREHGWA